MIGAGESVCFAAGFGLDDGATVSADVYEGIHFTCFVARNENRYAGIVMREELTCIFQLPSMTDDDWELAK